MDAKTLEYMKARVDRAQAINAALHELEVAVAGIEANPKRQYHPAYYDGRYQCEFLPNHGGIVGDLRSRLGIAARDLCRAFAAEEKARLEAELAEL